MNRWINEYGLVQRTNGLKNTIYDRKNQNYVPTGYCPIKWVVRNPPWDPPITNTLSASTLPLEQISSTTLLYSTQRFKNKRKTGTNNNSYINMQIRVFGCTICRIRVRTEYYLFTWKKLVTACVPGLPDADISIGSRQPCIDNRLQCTVSWTGLNGFDKKCLVLRGCQKKGQFIRINYHV